MTDQVTPAPTETGQPDVVTTPEAVAPPARPEHIPEKFWDASTGAVNVEALAKSYIELEKKQGQAPEPVPEVTPPVTAEPTTPEYVAIRDKASAELAETGALTEETYASFEKQGITREQVDTHIEGQKAIFELRKIKAERATGGEESYASMLAWAGANYSAEDAQAYNDSVFNGTEETFTKAVASLKAKYEEAMGSDGRIVTDGTAPAAPGGYQSKEEWMADLRDPRYKKDQAFQSEVRKKLEAALKNGVNLGVGSRVG